ncbi:MAG TPA: hypothetical protein VFR29_05305 [Steroidobacteraceae bacterium]|nr:hypothetical protein [Steroidobacteraceae bacterium]
MARLLPIAATLLLTGCGWIGLGWGAVTFPTTAAGEPANVVAGERFAYATRGADGIEIIELAAPAWRRVVAPAPGTTADDLALADGLLFVLDARPPGNLSVFSLANPELPTLVQPPVPVDVGPFSGVSAANGLVVVSGGTSLLTLRRYALDGRLSAEFASADLGRGQPDVLLGTDGRHAFVSTHDDGPFFSLSVLRLDRDALSIMHIASLPLATYGFTPGGARPANFPIEMAIAGENLLVASAAGLQLIDVSDPAQPRPRATLQPGALPVNVDARAGLAAVVGSDPDPELALVDLADPSAPKLLRSIRLPEGSYATGVAIAGRQAVVAAHAAGTLVFNLDDLTQ